jgi:hypothetical protein
MEEGTSHPFTAIQYSGLEYASLHITYMPSWDHSLIEWQLCLSFSFASGETNLLKKEYHLL